MFGIVKRKLTEVDYRLWKPHFYSWYLPQDIENPGVRQPINPIEHMDCKEG